MPHVNTHCSSRFESHFVLFQISSGLGLYVASLCLALITQASRWVLYLNDRKTLAGAPSNAQEADDVCVMACAQSSISMYMKESFHVRRNKRLCNVGLFIRQTKAEFISIFHGLLSFNDSIMTTECLISIIKSVLKLFICIFIKSLL